MKNSRFREFLEKTTTKLPTLPLTHTTDGWVFEEKLISKKESLAPTKCTFLGDEILYLFYGRPTYRVNANVESTDQEAFHSICFVIDGSAVTNVRNIFPFDTGAFVTERYKEHLHPKMELGDFALGTRMDIAAKLIERIYGSNINYYMGRVRRDFESDNAPMSVRSYHSLVGSSSASATDTRRSSIELQSLDPIDIRSAKILAVVVPEQMLDRREVREFIELELSAKGVGYFCIHASPREDMALIMKEVRDFYKAEGLL
jgi:hypothetical protein